jgi:hypothetical protein
MFPVCYGGNCFWRLVLVASPEVRADRQFVRAEVGEARTEVGCERETSMAHTFRDWRDTSWQQTAPGRSWFAHDHGDRQHWLRLNRGLYIFGCFRNWRLAQRRFPRSWFVMFITV